MPPQYHQHQKYYHHTTITPCTITKLSHCHHNNCTTIKTTITPPSLHTSSHCHTLSCQWSLHYITLLSQGYDMTITPLWLPSKLPSHNHCRTLPSPITINTITQPSHNYHNTTITQLQYHNTTITMLWSHLPSKCHNTTFTLPSHYHYITIMSPSHHLITTITHNYHQSHYQHTTITLFGYYWAMHPWPQLTLLCHYITIIILITTMIYI